ncbi:MAG: T9SS type A sorting domain-containing protein, partial [Candidatus Omnitrophica bacterium]|nr:T9SS type A sorting domain-containing protein [Candidatus Omnitrophota bacterium]
VFHWTRILPVNGVIIMNNNATAVDQVYADPIAFYPKYGEVTDITYGIAEDANVTVTLINSLGNSVRVLVNNQAKTAGNHSIEWDGLDDSGDTVSDTGIYSIQVDVTQGSTTKTLSGTVSVF